MEDVWGSSTNGRAPGVTSPERCRFESGLAHQRRVTADNSLLTLMLIIGFRLGNQGCSRLCLLHHGGEGEAAKVNHLLTYLWPTAGKDLLPGVSRPGLYGVLV